MLCFLFLFVVAILRFLFVFLTQIPYQKRHCGFECHRYQVLNVQMINTLWVSLYKQGYFTLFKLIAEIEPDSGLAGEIHLVKKNLDLPM